MTQGEVNHLEDCNRKLQQDIETWKVKHDALAFCLDVVAEALGKPGSGAPYGELGGWVKELREERDAADGRANTMRSALLSISRRASEAL